MNVTVLAHNAFKRIADVVQAIAVVNELQGEFVFHLEQVDWLPNGAKEIAPQLVVSRAA
jgi:hypothetical protein